MVSNFHVHKWCGFWAYNLIMTHGAHLVLYVVIKRFLYCRIQYGRSTGERPWLTIEDTVLEQTGILIGMYVCVYVAIC